MDVNKLTAMASRLSISQLQQAMRDGSLPPYVGMPILQQKAKEAQAMKNAQGAAQPKPPTVAQQVEGEAQQANIEDLMRQRAAIMQGQMAGTGGISDMLRKPEPEAMAKGGEVKRFAVAGVVPGVFSIQQAYDIIQDPQADPADKFKAKQIIANQGSAYVGSEPAINKRSNTLNVGSGTVQTPVATADQIKGFLSDAGAKYGVPENIMHGVGRVESSFNPNARSKDSSAAGVGQFTEAAWKDYGTGNPNDRYNPQLSAEAMARYLKNNNDKFGGDWGKAVSAYHLGPNASEEALAADSKYRNNVLGVNQPTGVSEQSSGIPTLVSTQAPQLSDIYSGMEIGKGSTPEEERAAYEKYMGPNKGLESLRGEISKMKEEATADKDKAGWMALLKAGLATMGGTSPYALTNIGQGAQAGVADYIEAQKDFRKERDRLVELQAKADDADRQEARAIYTHGEQSSAAKNAIRRSDLADQRRGKQETAVQNAQLELSNRTKDITAYGTQLEAAKLGLSDQEREQQFMQAYAIVNNPNATPQQKAQAQSVINGYTEMQNAKSPWRVSKQTASMLETAQDNYAKFYNEQIKEDSTAKPISFSEWLAQRYTPSQIKEMTGGETIGVQQQGGDIQSQAIEIARKRGLTK